MGIELLTICKKDESTIKTDDKITVYLKHAEYDDEAYAAIRKEASKWNIEVTNDYGYDYGYDERSSSTSVTHREIEDESLIVENGHFAGVLMKSSGKSFNRYTTVYNDLKAALIRNWEKDEGVFCARTGESFSSDDHSKWDYYEYYLVKKADNKRK